MNLQCALFYLGGPARLCTALPDRSESDRRLVRVHCMDGH